MTLVPTQVSFRGLAHSDAIEADVQDRVAWLEQFYSGIVRCRVLIDLPHRHRRDGRPLHVRIEMTVPGGSPIVVNHEPSLHGHLKDVGGETHRKVTEIDGAHRDAQVALHDAFDAARRRLEDFARERRGDVKTHVAPE